MSEDFGGKFELVKNSGKRNARSEFLIFGLSVLPAALAIGCQQSDYSSYQAVDPVTNEFIYPCTAQDSIAAITLLLQKMRDHCSRENRRLEAASLQSCAEGCLTEKTSGSSSSSGAFSLSMDIDQSLTNFQNRTIALKLRYTLPSKAEVTNLTCENPVNSTRFVSSLTDYLKVQCELIANTGAADTATSFQPGKVYGTARDLPGSWPLEKSASMRVRFSNNTNDCSLELKNKYLKQFASEIVLKTSDFAGSSVSCPTGTVALETELRSEKRAQRSVPAIYLKASSQGSLEIGFELIGRRSSGPSNSSFCMDPKLTTAYRQFQAYLDENWNEILVNSGCSKQ